MKNQEILNVSWRTVSRLCANIAAEIKASEQAPTAVLAIVRGGLVPSAIIAHHLKIRKIICVNAERTANDSAWPRKKPPRIRIDTSQPLANERVLVIEDVVSTGMTLELVLECLIERQTKTITTAALVLNTRSHKNRLIPDFVGMTSQYWVKFPWECVISRSQNKQVT